MSGKCSVQRSSLSRYALWLSDVALCLTDVKFVLPQMNNLSLEQRSKALQMDPSSMYLQPSHIGGEDRYNMQVHVNTFHLRLNAVTALRVLLHNCTRSIKTHTMIH